MEKLSKIKELVASVEKDADKFYSLGNAVSGTRLRKAMQNLKILAQEIRIEVTEKKNAK
ncbi:histone H1 [Pedobacter nutrimenti]|uniref:histone H1 n=1 Tax=Pedobacter nutrimenti TaxID=1241337 RepID=UPI002931CA0F|nr:histone H1 [Pedobacter nutrimenti]